MLSFGEYYLRNNPINQSNWNPYLVSFDLNNSLNLPYILTHGIPKYTSDNWNIFSFTPPLEFGYIPPINYGFQQIAFNPFAFLTQTTTNNNSNNPFGFITGIPSFITYNPSENPFSFLNNRTKNSNTGTTQITSTNRTRKVGQRVAEEILPGKEVLKIGNGINLSSLNKDLKVKLVRLSEKAEQLGYTLVVSDGFRTHEQQIAAKRNKPRLAATPGKSPHEYGAGIDIALYDKNGKQVNIANIPEFADFAKSIGLAWGNDWTSKKEPWHFELANWRTRSDIAPEYRRRNNTAIA